MICVDAIVVLCVSHGCSCLCGCLLCMMCLMMALHPRGFIVPEGLVREDMGPLEHLVANIVAKRSTFSLHKVMME